MIINTNKNLIVGVSRNFHCSRTLEVFYNKISKIVELKGERVIDIGCGDGTFTLKFTRNFKEVYAIGLQENYLNEFRRKTKNSDKYFIYRMNSEKMDFPDNFFDCIISFETIEHIENLNNAILEMHRTLKLNGKLVLTCPNRLFPFENHGFKIFGKEYHRRVPLLTYFPYLHNKFSLARVFTQNSIRKLFSSTGFEVLSFDYLLPTFEHGGNKLQPLIKFLFPVMRKIENSPLKIFGTSIVGIFEKK